MRIGVFATHPVQYQAPWFRALSAAPDVDLTVFYGLIPSRTQQGVGFGVEFEWDVPLLAGYRHEVLPNRAARPALGRFGGCDVPDIYATLRTRRFDAFLVTGWGSKANIQALLACRRSGTPCIVRGESNALRPRPWPVRLAHRVLLAQYRAFLAIGRSNSDFYLRNGVRSEAIFPGPYCVDNERLQADADRLRPHRRQIRSDWRIPAEAFVFLFCGKLIQKKRPTDLIEALSRVAALGSGGRPIHLLVVGDGALRSSCERMARARGIAATFAGFLNQTEVARGYVAADCLVLPSDFGETWGLVVNEAMASGLPAVVSDRVGCHPDLIRDGETGSVFPFGDVDSLAQSLLALASCSEGAEAMGRRARQAVQPYSIEKLVDGTLDALRYATAAPSGNTSAAHSVEIPR